MEEGHGWLIQSDEGKHMYFVVLYVFDMYSSSGGGTPYIDHKICT